MQQQQESVLEQIECVYEQKQFNVDTAQFEISYPVVFYNSNRVLRAKIFLQPKVNLVNLPVEVELRGVSTLMNFGNGGAKKENELEMTESCLNEGQDRLQANFIMGKSLESQNQSAVNQKDINKTKSESNIDQEGQYFLQGCLVLYQLDQINQIRLQTLVTQKRYYYPIQFMLPSNLPLSMSTVLLNDMHITIKYTIEIKFILRTIEGIDRSYLYVLPFQIRQKPKLYPYEELISTQKIRFYHQNGKKEDQFLKNNLTRVIRCLCPESVFKKYLKNKQIFSSYYERYDLYYVQLLAVVNKDHSVFFTARAFKDPQQQQLTINREKKIKPPQQLQVKSLSELPQDVSLASVKLTQRRESDLAVVSVDVTMWGEIVNVCKQKIFSKTIYLSHFNYDMIEGQCIVQLGDYLQHPMTCHNQLFNFAFSFSLKANFSNQENQNQKVFQSYVIDECNNELIL